jgi:flavin reductase (DIM6/NTAB) family NADH-FMN oxidoreductase RutF
MIELEQAFRRSMRALTSAVSIISTAYEGCNFGMTATSVTSVSMTLPSLLACINKMASLHDPLVRSGRFYVNLLHAYQSNLAGAFSRVPPEVRFVNGKWDFDLDHLPYLVGAQANILCDVDQSCDYGSRTIIIGRVRAVTVCDPINPLLYQDGKYAVRGAEAVKPALRSIDMLLS